MGDTNTERAIGMLQAQQEICDRDREHIWNALEDIKKSLHVIALNTAPIQSVIDRQEAEARKLAAQVHQLTDFNAKLKTARYILGSIALAVGGFISFVFREFIVPMLRG